MREIGRLSNEQSASRFVDYLLTLGMKADVEPQADDWAVWIFDEDHVEDAKRELAEFQQDSNNSRYVTAAHRATTLRKETEKQARGTSKRVVNLKDRWDRPATMSFPVTMTLIAASIIVAVFSQLGEKTEPVITKLAIAPVFQDGVMKSWYPHDGLQAIRQGQLWRLFSPMLIHYGPFHLLFNMIMLYRLGVPIELRRGSARYAVIVLATAGVSNLAQFWYSGPFFGGMSGVVYGLFAYIWMKSRYDPVDGFFMHPDIVIWMMGWFFLCFSGLVGDIANAAHTVGLVMGAVIALLPVTWRKLQRL